MNLRVIWKLFYQGNVRNFFPFLFCQVILIGSFLSGCKDIGSSVKIIGGKHTQNPGYVVYLKDKFGFFCGASLIARDIVLTAAHCGGGDMSVVVDVTVQNKGDKGIEVIKDVEYKGYDADITNGDFQIGRAHV